MIIRTLLLPALLLYAWLASFEMSAAQVPPTYTDPEGFSLTCYAPHFRTGQMVPVIGQNYPTGGYYGYATAMPDGHPIILFNTNILLGKHPIIARFTYYHECAHFKVAAGDEIAANCVGLKDMRAAGHISLEDEEIIKKDTLSYPILEPKHGGSGRAYWEATIECANSKE